MCPLRPLQQLWLHMLFATAAGVGAEAHRVSISRNWTPTGAIVADCAGAVRLEIALLAMAVMLRLAKMHTNLVSMHGTCRPFHS